ncbi:hypothetical protein LINGRAHAP2_LOCUS7843, partial [Linum grandiflorum]
LHFRFCFPLSSGSRRLNFTLAFCFVVCRFKSGVWFDVQIEFVSRLSDIINYHQEPYFHRDHHQHINPSTS